MQSKIHFFYYEIHRIQNYILNYTIKMYFFILYFKMYYLKYNTFTLLFQIINRKNYGDGGQNYGGVEEIA